ARWIGCYAGSTNMRPVQHLSRTFTVDDTSETRIAIPALGLYQAEINGQKVTSDLFTPGWTDYYQRVQYQVYDGSGLLRKGENEITVYLGEGWYCGRISRHWSQGKPTWGEHPMLLAELRRGKETLLVTDENWKSHICCRRWSDIYDGEKYDGTRLSPTGEIVAPYTCAEAPPVQVFPAPPVAVEWQSGAPVREVAVLKPVAVERCSNGVIRVDFGQNFTGRERIKLRNPGRGAVITLRHGEMVNRDGSLYTANLRTAEATTTYISCGLEEEIYEPLFTFYGFRYLEISGWPGEFTADSVEGSVISSALAPTGSFSCSNHLVNTLFTNVLNGQRSNFVDVPTDCPQRDEKYGWTGDTQIFCNMGTWNSFAPEFYTKWITDLNSDIMDSDCYPYYSPNPFGRPRAEDLLKDFHPYTRYGSYSAGWSDAGVVCPWIMYEKYADTRLMEKFLPNILRQMDHVAANSDHFIVDAGHFKDWLNIDQPTQSKFLGTAYFAGMTFLAAKMAKITGRKEDAARMFSLHEAVKEAFQKKFFTPDGNIFIEEPAKHCITKEVMYVPCTQTAALLTLHFSLAPEGAEEK
ncbi:MAG: family 78 glycoside hydrolase catalytic domain, partial [Lentisphaeria bacterium]|nr:family 78 glycoside hydrolase catalytic domain [Lentisphaeria bacterium]